MNEQKQRSISCNINFINILIINNLTNNFTPDKSPKLINKVSFGDLLKQFYSANRSSIVT